MAKVNFQPFEEAFPGEEEVKPAYEIRGQSMIDYSREQIDESQNLLGNRWLERGHGALVTGPS